MKEDGFFIKDTLQNGARLIFICLSGKNCRHVSIEICYVMDSYIFANATH